MSYDQDHGAEYEGFRPYRTSLFERKTHKYVGSWQHEDEWQYVGCVSVLHRNSQITDEEDPCEPTRTLMLVEVQPDPGIVVAADVVVQALKDTFTKEGCSHDWDCCGCWSTHVSEVLPLRHAANQYVVITHASRNY